MADLTYIQRDGEIQIVGQDASGNQVNYVTADANGNMAVKDYADGTPGSAVPPVATQVGGKNTSGNLQAVSIDRNGFTNVNINTDKSVFGPLITLSRVQQVSADFSQALVNNDLTQTTSGGATITLATSNATLATGTATTASAQLQTITNIVYSPGREIYAQFTGAFTTPTSAASTQLMGLYNGTDGIVLGYNGLNFSIGTYAGGTSTFVASSSFNLDTLTGGANSQFTRGGTPEAVNFTFKNVYRIRAGWLGAAPIYFEILSPDGNWVTFHMVRQPNTSINPAFLQPSLPFTTIVTKTASDATNLKIVTTSWDAGIVDVSGEVDSANSGSIGALNATAVINTEAKQTAVIDVTGTWVGTLQVQGDVGDGTWNPVSVATATGAIYNGGIESNQTLIAACAGYSAMRVTFTAYTSGTANLNWVTTQGPQYLFVQSIGTVVSGTTGGRSFHVTTNHISTGATAETPLLYFNNPSASGKTVKISKLIFSAPTRADGNFNTYRVYVNPTVTANGTSITPVGSRQTNQASTVVTTHSATGITTSANGSLFLAFDLAIGSVPFVFQELNQWVEAGNSLLITTTLSNAADTACVSMEWLEE